MNNLFPYFGKVFFFFFYLAYGIMFNHVLLLIKNNKNKKLIAIAEARVEMRG